MLPYASDVNSSQKEAFEIEQSPETVSGGNASPGKSMAMKRLVGVGLGCLALAVVIVVLTSHGSGQGALGRVVHRGLADLQDQYPKKVQGVPISFWMQTALPQDGSCFEGEPWARDPLLLYRQRAYEDARRATARLVERHGRIESDADRRALGLMLEIDMNMDSFRGELGSHPHAALQINVEADAKDPYALFAGALWKAKLGFGGDEVFQLEKLREVDAKAADAVASIHEKVDHAFSNDGYFGEGTPDPEKVPPKLRADRQEIKDLKGQKVAILVFGWGPEKNGRIPETLRDRLDAAKQMAETFRTAPIIIAGGAANSPEIESVFIRRQMIKEYQRDSTENKDAIKERIICATNTRDVLGVAIVAAEILHERKNIDKIILVSSAWQLPRITLTVEAALKVRGLEPTLYPAATGNKPHIPAHTRLSKAPLEERRKKELKNRIENVEKRASYRDLARAQKLFTYCDFKTSSDFKSGQD